VGIKIPVAVGILVDGYPIFPSKGRVGSVGRRRRIGWVVNVSKDLVVRDHPQSCWPRVLPVLNHPHATSFVKVDVQRISYIRLTEYEFDFKIVQRYQFRKSSFFNGSRL
jgi:hypothetical protein